MDPISIYFFAIASIIGIEATGIVSQKATVTINPVAQTFEIHQEDLFSIMATREDSLAVANEFWQIAELQQDIAERYVDGWIVEEIIFSRKGEQLNALLKGRFTEAIVLAQAGIHIDSALNSGFSLMNFPDWNIRSADAVLKENYWCWPTDKTVTIIMEPYKIIPDDYIGDKRSMLAYWNEWLNSQSKK